MLCWRGITFFFVHSLSLRDDQKPLRAAIIPPCVWKGKPPATDEQRPFLRPCPVSFDVLLACAHDALFPRSSHTSFAESSFDTYVFVMPGLVKRHWHEPPHHFFFSRMAEYISSLQTNYERINQITYIRKIKETKLNITCSQIWAPRNPMPLCTTCTTTAAGMGLSIVTLFF